MMRNASNFLKTPLYRKVHRKIRGWLKASLKFFAPHSLDTITTRFFILFLFLLSVPLASVIVYSRDFLVSQQERLASNQLSNHYQLFAREIQGVKAQLRVYAQMPSEAIASACNGDAVSLCLSGSSKNAHSTSLKVFEFGNNFQLGKTLEISESEMAHLNELRPLQPAFLTLSRTLYLLVKTPTSVQSGQFWVLGKPLDRAFLNHFYRDYSEGLTHLLVMGSPVVATESSGLLNVESTLSMPQAKTLRLKLGRTKPPTFADKGLPFLVQDKAIGDQLVILQPIYDAQDQPIAQIAYMLSLERSILALRDYYQVIYWILIASLVFSMGLAMLAGRTITQPMLQLIGQVNELSRMKILKGSQPVQVKGVFEITQLSAAFNRMMDRLEKEQALKDNFVATLTHDLKVPLLAKKQTLAYFLKEVYGPVNETQLEILQTLQSTNQDCLGLVSSLLEIYRYSSGGVALLWETFNLLNLLNQTIEELKSLAQEKFITIEKDFELLEGEKDYLVYADPVEIRRVLHNLLSNAITNTPSYGVIQCRVGTGNYFGGNTIYKVSGFGHTTLKYPIKLSGKMLVVIQDSGIGFSKEELPELFKQFTSNKGRNPMSIGLGLHNCYQVIQAHNNVLWVESTEGVGSAVSFTLSTNQTVAQDRRIFSDRRKKR